METFPGVGINCPDKNEESNSPNDANSTTDRKQILAEFKKRFFKILDIGIHGESVENETFENRSFSEIAYKLKVHCSGKKIYFNDCLLEIIRLTKRSWIVIESLIQAKVNKIFSQSQSHKWNVSGAEYNQMMEVIVYKQIKLRCAKEACKYVFTPGREDILKEIAGYALLQYYSLNFVIDSALISTWLISLITSLLSIIPWNRIMSHLIYNTKISCEPITVFDMENEQGLAAIKKYLIKASRRPKPKGFSKRKKL